MDDPALPALLGETLSGELREHIALVTGAGNAFDRRRFLAGDLTPVFFGSALNNFGVEPFLDALLNLAPEPGAFEKNGFLLQPTEECFTGFVFKIQANMDPRHRDRMAFLRILSGRFEKNMIAYHPRLEREVRLARAYRIFAREREPVREAFAGDIIGVINPGLFVIGDTVTTGKTAAFIDIPRFPPEHFAVLINQEIGRYKQFNKGLSQLEEEGAVQIMYAAAGARREPILAAVGALQFDVVLSRLRQEYGVEARIERLPFTCARWIKSESIERMTLGSGVLQCRDHNGDTVVLFASNWHLEYFHKENPDIEIVKVGSPWINKN